MEREMEFFNRIAFDMKLGNHEIPISYTILDTWILMAVFIIFAIIVRISLKNFATIPKGFQNVVEALVEAFEKFTVSIMGEKNRKYSALFGSMFLFILASNYAGLFGFRPPTADVATTLSLAIISFFTIQYSGLKEKKLKGFLEDFFKPHPLFFPMKIIEKVAPVLSLTFRLFGNILGGTVIIGLFYYMPFWFVKLGIPVILHAYFDIFAGTLQPFIFVMLTMVFTSNAMAEE